MAEPTVICWDWKCLPNFDEIKDAIILHGNDCYIAQVDTKSDDHCVVIGPREMTDQQAIECYRKYAGYTS